MKFHLKQLVGCFSSLLLVVSIHYTSAQSPIIQSFHVHFGTLAPVSAPGFGYVFISDNGEEEIFDMSGRAFLENKTGSPPGMPNLREIGFKLDNAVEYFYKTKSGFRSEMLTLQAAAEENPEHKVMAKLFEGEGKSRLEIMLSGKTPVIRVDLKIDGKTVTLWSPRKDEAPKK